MLSLPVICQKIVQWRLLSITYMNTIWNMTSKTNPKFYAAPWIGLNLRDGLSAFQELACPDLSDLHMITFLLQKIFGETIINHLIMNLKRKKLKLMIPLMNRRAKKNQKILLMMIAIARLKKSCLNQQSASIKEKKAPARSAPAAKKTKAKPK